MPAPGAAAVPVNANPPVAIPPNDPPQSLARVLGQRGWTEQPDGNFYYPGVAFPRIHIVLSQFADNYNARVSIYKDVQTVEVQGMNPRGEVFSHVFWLNDVKQRYDIVLVNTALALLPAQGRLVLKELLEE